MSVVEFQKSDRFFKQADHFPFMGDQHKGTAMSFADIQQQSQDIFLVDRMKRGRRFVGQKELWPIC